MIKKKKGGVGIGWKFGLVQIAHRELCRQHRLINSVALVWVLSMLGHGVIFFFKQKTAHEISECDWSSDVCSSDPRLKSSHIQKSRMPSSACDWSSDVDRKRT